MKKLLYIMVIILSFILVTGCSGNESEFREELSRKINEQSTSVSEQEPLEEAQEPVETEQTQDNTQEEVREEEVREEEVREEEEAKEVEEVEEIEEVQEEETFKVTHVRDGDTFEIDYYGKNEAVRLIGIDTPESVHADESRNTEEGKIASDFTKELLKDAYVALEFDVEERDQYGRLLAYAYVDGEMVNKILLEKGYAQVATYPPNVKYVDVFTDLQRVARDNGVGLWGESVSDPASSKDSSSVVLIGSVNSDKYHIKGYTHDGQIAEHNIIVFDSEDHAAASGYVPCKACF